MDSGCWISESAVVIRCQLAGTHMTAGTAKFPWCQLADDCAGQPAQIRRWKATSRPLATLEKPRLEAALAHNALSLRISGASMGFAHVYYSLIAGDKHCK